MNCTECNLEPVFTKNLCNTCYQRSYFNENKVRIRERIRLQRAQKKLDDPAWFAKYKEDNKRDKRKPHSRFLESNRKAKKKNLAFTLTEIEYLNLIEQQCIYCEGYFPPVEYAIGLDRIDNDKGYEPFNVVPCCATCNHTRNDHFTVAETKAMITLVIQMRNND